MSSPRNARSRQTAADPLRPAREERAPGAAMAVVTRMEIDASPEQVWGGLLFYEQIAERPPLHLRLLLPRPIRTEGRKSEVGDDARCVYEGGHLLKRVTEVDAGRHYGFEVVEQDLAFGGGMRLSGGGYTLRGLPGGRTEVALETRYLSPRCPRWLWRPFESVVCHAFHRHILGAMRRSLLEALRSQPQNQRGAIAEPPGVRGRSEPWRAEPPLQGFSPAAAGRTSMARGTTVGGRAIQIIRTGLRHFALPALQRRPGSRAERAQAALEEMGGAWAKLGQALALRFDLLPADYCLQFFQLLNRMQPFPAAEVRRVVEEELGSPVEELFRSFDLAPVAAASIGQVHRAELPDGTRVAVKVQRPEVRDVIRADLRLMRWMAALVDAIPWAGHPSASRLVDEFARWTEEELDYRSEARHAAMLRLNAAGDPLERDPRVFLTHTTSRVLTLEYLEGIPVIDIVAALRRGDEAFLEDLASRGHDPLRIASHIVWNGLNQIYRQGCFHADPHPANLLVLPGDAIGYVDFGIVGRLDARTTDSLRFFAEDLFAGNVEPAVDEFMRFLTPSRQTDVGAARRDLVEVLRRYLESARVGPAGQAPQDLFEIEMLAAVRRNAMALSPDAVLYLKAVLTTDAVVQSLDPAFDLRAHENRFFARLRRREVAEALRPEALGRLVLGLRRRAVSVLDAVDRLEATPSQLGAVAGDVRRRVQALSAAAIAGWLALVALVAEPGGQWALIAFGSPLRTAALGAALGTLGILILAIRQVRRLPPHGGLPPSRPRARRGG